VAILVLLAVLGVLLFAFGKQLGIFEQQAKQVAVPGVVGKNVLIATKQLEDLKLKVRATTQESSEPEGNVLTQSPDEGANVDEGATVVLTVSGGAGTAVLPDLTGLTEPEARAKITEAGFADPTTRTEEVADKVPGTVLRTEPGPGTYPKDQAIVLVLAGAPASTTTAPTTTAPTTTTSTTTTTTTTTTTPPTTTAPVTTTTPVTSTTVAGP
jgi:serine/threonine-protein kinase